MADFKTSELLNTLGKEAPNFFGLTSLGINHFANAKPRTLPFHYFSPEDFVECFRSFRNEELEQALQESGKAKPGHEFILRSELSAVLKKLRDYADMSPQEWQAYHTYFDSDTAGVISLDEFNRSVSRLREWSENVEQGRGTDPVHYRSGLRLREEKARHRRLLDDPQTYIRKPVTGNQARIPSLRLGDDLLASGQLPTLSLPSRPPLRPAPQSIGWATGVAPVAVATALDPLRSHNPQYQTDIRTEGRGAADYAY